MVEQRYVGVKADVYSFGVVLWEMLTGQIPYDGMELEEVCASICRGEHPILRPDLHRRVAGAGAGICRVMASCWNLCPTARPSCAQLLSDLAKVKDAGNQRSIPSPPPPPPPPAPHTRPPRPEGHLGSPEEKRSLLSAAMGFNVTREDLEAQRSRLRRTETPATGADEHEEEIEAASNSLLSQIMKKAIRERRADSGWGQRVRRFCRRLLFSAG